ncbi:hypothetical protein [Curtobacterium sp. NPDC092190]|uniref:hypothetical protein n=1 Tax=Curtobacterium sp. NPDC092190 TaxID=3363973 RepID=UPI0038269BF6
MADFGYAVLLRVHELLRYIIRYSIVECLGFSPVSLNDDEMMLDTGKADVHVAAASMTCAHHPGLTCSMTARHA